jgi:tetratricopeptide (TPR) repeat protein
MHGAHQRGIVHRDLKPANVLLTADGTPKITDFGLAKRLEAPGQTQTGAVMGTPNYMAPEQAAGMSRDVGPLADVYALGAILYEMLTGQPPFQAGTPLKVISLVISEEPVAPSRLQEKVARDLETICLKCLHKVPQLRYGSALELAEDLRRFRSDEPILARPVSAAERTLKWIKRRPTLAALVLVSVLATLSLAVGGFWHNARLRTERDRAEANYQRAEQNFQRARQAVDSMLTEVAQKQLADEPLMEQKRRVLLEKALGFYQEFLQEKSSDPTLRQATAQAYKQVGDISRLLRRDEQAEHAYEQAIAMLTALAEEFPDQPALRQQLAESQDFRGEVLRLAGRPAQAQEAYEAALSIERQLAEQFPAEGAYRRDQARTQYNLGILLTSTKPREARQHFAASIALGTELAAQYPDVPEYRQHLARGYLNQGPVLRVTDGFEPARASYDQAITLLEELHRRHPYVRDYQHELGVAYNNLGILLRGAANYAEAGAAHQSALALFSKLVANFPRVPDYRKELANTHDTLGTLRTLEHSFSEAGQCYGQARKLFGGLVGEFADVPDYQALLAMTVGNQAWLCTEQKDWAGARPLTEDAIGRLKKVLHSHPDHRFGQQLLRKQYQSLAETLIQLHDHAGAAAAAIELPTILPDRPQDYYYAACFLARCVPLAESDGRLGDVRGRQQVIDGYTDQALAMLREALRKDDKSWQRLPNEADVLRPLERREDFRQLRVRLEARTAQATRGTAP